MGRLAHAEAAESVPDAFVAVVEEHLREELEEPDLGSDAPVAGHEPSDDDRRGQ